MGKSHLVGYVRKSRRGAAVKVDIGIEEFLLSKRYSTKDGKQFVNLVINIHALKDVLDGKRKVTSISQLTK